MTILCSIPLLALHALANFPGISARKHNRLKHEALNVAHPRQIRPSILHIPDNLTVEEQCPTTTKPILSVFFPSPGAAPVEIRTQSEVVTSYVPDYTWCVAPPLGLVPIATLTGSPYGNGSTLYSTTTAGTGSCETAYQPTTTTICATTLTGLASKITVSECDQEITFSSECGFTLQDVTPTTNNSAMVTPAPTIKSMMTYWVAPWQSLTLGETPSDVDVKICTMHGDNGTMECIHYQEVWEIVVVTQTVTTQREVQLTTTLSGPGTLVVETIHAYINDTIAYIDLSTTLLLETEVETESISKSRKLVGRPDSGQPPASTTYITRTVHYRSTPTSAEPTTTVHLTSVFTQHVDILTRTRPRLPPRPAFPVPPVQ